MDATHRRFETLFDSIRHRRGSWRATVAEKLRMVRLAVQEAGCGAVPTDLTRLARHLRVVKITERSLTMRGRILRSELGYEIQINEELPDTSKRDVLAHELSHLVVEDRSIATSNRLNRERSDFASSYGSVEKLCDECAFEILLPLGWLRDRLRGTRPSAEVLRNIAEAAGCSVEYAAKRIWTEALWDCRFSVWQSAGDRTFALRSYPPEPAETLASWALELAAKSAPSSLSPHGNQSLREISARFECMGVRRTVACLVEESTVLVVDLGKSKP